MDAVGTDRRSGTDRKNSKSLLRTIQKIHQIKDVNLLLERTLHEARRFVHADAGTLYLASGDRLYFNYIENDTLFREHDAREKYVYSNNSIKIDRSSLAGYVALSGESLIIDDVYDIKSGVSYQFNPFFDQATRYHTQSQLVVPLTTTDNRTLGVLQLINAQDENGRTVSFSVNDRLFISYFAQHAASAIEKAELSRQMVLRMVEMAELRDPYETIPHAKRVGDYSLELYDKWAIRHDIPLNERNIKKDMFRTAAILHDVGKVAIADSILQKRGELNREEKLGMQMHTIYGARLFARKNTHWDKIAAEVALNHHERWDGTGYPGHLPDLHAESIDFGPGKRGKDIPLSARIVAISDVYDALISERAYKEPWKEESALTYIKKQAGKQFDPELVELFLGMGDIIQAIREKYTEE